MRVHIVYATLTVPILSSGKFSRHKYSVTSPWPQGIRICQATVLQSVHVAVVQSLVMQNLVRVLS